MLKSKCFPDSVPRAQQAKADENGDDDVEGNCQGPVGCSDVHSQL